MCFLSVYTLLKVVGYYDLSVVLSMSVMGLQKMWMGVGGGVSSIQFFWTFVNFAKPLTLLTIVAAGGETWLLVSSARRHALLGRRLASE